MITASTPFRSGSACHSSSASPTRRAANSASRSSQEPGNWTTPYFTSESRSPRSRDSSAGVRTWRPPATDRRRRARPSGRRARCARLRTPAPGAPAPRPGPADPGSRPWAGSGPAPSRSRPLQPGRERLAGEPLVRGHVALARLRHHVVGDRRRGRRLVPAGAGRPVAHVLLIEARLPAPDRVLVGRPEARRVGGAHLVAEHELAIGIEPELELRVREDDPALARVVSHRAVDSQRNLAQPLAQLARAGQLGRLIEVDRLVVPDLGLGGRREDRLRELLGLLQPGGKLDA